MSAAAVGALAAVLSLYNLVFRSRIGQHSRLARFSDPIDWTLAVVGLLVTLISLVGLFNGNFSLGLAVLLVAVLIATPGFAVFIVLAAFWREKKPTETDETAAPDAS
ncbi:hypothetical protein [Microbacterium binotii]|uniref:hypothetical protein n=1 Tax=Microbacterium binotii TaxID=462710 RepID=UPI001F3C58FE|nr:hypothetical protein [Microbacterium binotii]UIN30923.1 hypothetical protein LXM64_01570 [Microbacterium binotii]